MPPTTFQEVMVGRLGLFHCGYWYMDHFIFMQLMLLPKGRVGHLRRFQFVHFLYNFYVLDQIQNRRCLTLRGPGGSELHGWPSGVPGDPIYFWQYPGYY